MTQNSPPLDLKVVTSSDRKDIPSLPQNTTQTLVTLTKALAEIEADPNSAPTGYLKSYCEIRANCMIKSLAPLYQSSMVELRGVYDKGSSPFIPYTTSLLKLCRVSETDFQRISRTLYSLDPNIFLYQLQTFRTKLICRILYWTPNC